MGYSLRRDGTVLDTSEHPVPIDRVALERRALRGDEPALRVLERLWRREAVEKAIRCFMDGCRSDCEGCR